MDKINVFSILIICGYMLFSCDSSKKQVVSEHLKSIDSLLLEVGIPTEMKKCGNSIFIVDMFNGDSLISIYDIEKKKKIYSFGKKGNGPNEFLHISNLDISYNEKNELLLYVFDPIRKKITTYKYDSLMNKTNILCNEETIKDHIPYLEGVWKLENGYISIGRMENNKYVLLSDSLDILKFSGNYRPKHDKNISNVLHRRANHGKIELSWDKKTMVEIVYNASVLSCYNIKTDSLDKKWEHVIEELDYHIDGKEIVNNNVMGYLSASVGSHYVYALYSGHYANPDEIATYGNEVHVYDNQGNLKFNLILESPAFLLSVDENKGKIFALCHEPETTVMIYNLPCFDKIQNN